MSDKKQIDFHRYVFNEKTGEKVYTHYTDKSPIELSPEQKAKYDEGKKIATTKALEEIEKTPAMRKKPHQKRGIQV